ncbi:MAG: hypothetical protein B1H04_06050 [Planctomycetales bacterium 4484_123]|nr:MAG: hypothetical protein B1H04_06050 [Planctomycetales bacterium 4484_123]
MLAAAAGGCGLKNKQKLAAHQRWCETRARVIASVGAEHLKVGDLDKAADSAKQALSLAPSCVPARVLLAKVLLEKGRYAAAAEALRGCQSDAPENPEVPYLLGVAHEKRKQYAEALRQYQKACALDPSNDAYVIASAEVLVAQGKAALALELLESRLERIDGGVPMLLLAGELAMMVGQPVKAAGLYRRCLDAERDYKEKVSWVYIMMGDCYLASRRVAEARGAYEVAVRIDPGDAEIWLCLAKAALAGGDPSAAAKAARRALALKGDSLDANLLLACALLAQDRPEEASKLLLRAAQADPRNATVLCMLGRCCQALGKKDQAVSYYLRALRSDPDHPLAKHLLAGIELGGSQGRR